MPLWITELMRWLGVTSDSKRPNLGALLVLSAAILLAMGYQPEDVGTFGEQLARMISKLTEFVTKPDNALGVALAGLGYTMLRGRTGTELAPDEVTALRAELEALRARREAQKPPLETE